MPKNMIWITIIEHDYTYEPVMVTDWILLHRNMLGTETTCKERQVSNQSPDVTEPTTPMKITISIWRPTTLTDVH